MRAVLVVLGVALVLGSAPAAFAASATSAQDGDDSIPGGLRDRYEAVCNGKGFIEATVVADNGTDGYTVSITCTAGVDSKGNNGSNSGTGVVSASVGDKCSRADIDVICAGSACPGPDCGSYTVTVDCLTNPIQRLEGPSAGQADDVP